MPLLSKEASDLSQKMLFSTFHEAIYTSQDRTVASTKLGITPLDILDIVIASPFAYNTLETTPPDELRKRYSKYDGIIASCFSKKPCPTARLELAPKMQVAGTEKAADTGEHAANPRKRAADTGGQPADAERLVSNANKRAESAKKRATDARKKVADAEKQAADAEKRATDAEKRATDAEKRAADAEKRATDAEKRAADSERQVDALEDALGKSSALTELLQEMLTPNMASLPTAQDPAYGARAYGTMGPSLAILNSYEIDAAARADTAAHAAHTDTNAVKRPRLQPSTNFRLA